MTSRPDGPETLTDGQQNVGATGNGPTGSQTLRKKTIISGRPERGAHGGGALPGAHGHVHGGSTFQGGFWDMGNPILRVPGPQNVFKIV